MKPRSNQFKTVLLHQSKACCGLFMAILILQVCTSISCAQDTGFQFSLRSVFDKNAEQYLVEKVNIRTFHEIFKPHQSYWAAAANDTPALMTFRFPLEKPMKSGRLYTDILAVNFENDPKLGFGRGEGSLWCSSDGKRWIRLLEAKEPTSTALSLVTYSDLLPPELVGAREIWIQVRLLASGMKDGTYSVAQFARKRVDDPHSNVFDLRIKYDLTEPAGNISARNGVLR